MSQRVLVVGDLVDDISVRVLDDVTVTQERSGLRLRLEVEELLTHRRQAANHGA